MLVDRIENRDLVVREGIADDPSVDEPRGARVVDLIPHRIDLQQVREIAAPLRFRGHGPVDRGGLFGFHVLESVVAEEEEQLVAAVEEAGQRDGAAEHGRPVVWMPGGDFGSAAQRSASACSPSAIACLMPP